MQVPLFTHMVPIKRLRSSEWPLEFHLHIKSAILKSYRKMKIKFLVIVFTAIAIGAQCRSIELSSVRATGEENPVNMPEQLKELITSYEKNFAKLIDFAIKISRDKNNNKREIQVLNQLGSLVDQLAREQSKMKSMYIKLDNDTNSILQTPNNKPTMTSVNNVKELIDYMKEIDIVYQDGDITDEHIRIKRAEGTASFAMLEERMTNVLIDIQHQLMQIQKCLDKLCKKHHLTSTITSEEISDDNIFNQPNKVSIV